MSNQLLDKVEVLLFALGRPLSHTEIATKLAVSVEEIKKLQNESGRGIVLVNDGKTFELRTAPEHASLIEKVRKEEYSREVGRAGLEALAAVLYLGPQTRAQIDFVRGVNSSQTLRTLTIRGLLRKVPNPKDERSFLYEPTTGLLGLLGVTESDELPEFSQFAEKLRNLSTNYQQAA